MIGALAGVRLLTSLLDPAQYGEITLGMTAAALINQLIFGPLSNGISRFYAPATEQRDLGSYLIASCRLMLQASGLIGLLIIFVFAGLLLTGKWEWLGLAVGTLLFSIFSGCNEVMNGIQNAARHRSIVTLHRGLEPWCRFLTAAALIVLLGANSTAAIAGYVIATIFVLISQYIFLRRRMPQRNADAETARKWRERIWEFSAPFAIWGVFTWAQIASDRWALGYFRSTQDVGLYAVLFQLGYYPMSLASDLVIQFLTPILFQRMGNSADGRQNAGVSRISWHLTAWVLAVTAAAFAAALLFHSYIFGLFVAAKYASVSYLLPWMILIGGMFAAGQTLSINLLCHMRSRALLPVKVTTAIIGTVLNFAGAWWLGITGIIIAGGLFSIMYFIWSAALIIFPIKKGEFGKT